MYHTNPRYKDVLRQYKNSHLSILLSLLNETSSLIYNDIYCYLFISILIKSIERTIT